MRTSLRLPVTDLRRRLGTQRDETRRVVASDIADLTAVAGTSVPSDGEISIDVTLESVPEGIMVDGTLTAPWVAECRRCLNPVSGVVETNVRELFEVSPSVGETYPLEDGTIDIEAMVRDSVLLALPLSVVCRDDCAGPDPDRFPTTVEDDSASAPTPEGQGDPDAPQGDPRWAALGEIRFDD